MKNTILFLMVVAIIAPSAIRAQDTTVHCPMPCGNESFPYIFCSFTGHQTAHCSTNPHDGTNGVPAMSKMPGCVNVIPPDTSADFQPSGDTPPFTETRPTPPDRETIFERYKNAGLENELSGIPGPPPWDIPYDVGDNADVWWGDDPSSFGPALDQWNLDSSNFLAGLGWELIDTSGLGDHAIAAISYGNDGYGWLWEEYDHEETTYDSLLSSYETDSTNYANGLDQPYDQVWNNGSANGDAQEDLHAWLGVCNLTGDITCCILVKGDSNVTHWPGNYQGGATGKIGYAVGHTYGTPGCPDGSGCPDPANRYITYNTTNNFYYKNNFNIRTISPEYQLHSTIPLVGWYTGPGPDPGVINQGYNDFSFQEIIEHEMGHWLGLMHPDSILSGDTCKNNYNYCKSSIPGYWMLMGSSQAKQNIAPRGLGSDDSCMFAKLYCPTISDTTLGVSQPQVPDWFNPEVFPNPSNGEMTLTFGVHIRSFTQIDIYDILGNAMKEVSSGYSNAGTQSISLGTETLPPGNYVCQVRVGDMVSYINLVITK